LPLSLATTRTVFAMACPFALVTVVEKINNT
jgi:hypothetical protein